MKDQRLVVFFFCLATAVRLPTLGAQAAARTPGDLNVPPYTPSGAGRLLPFATGHVDICERLSPAEEQRVISSLRRVDEIFRRVPVLSPPAGVEVRPHAIVGGITPDQCNRLTRANVRYQIFKPTIAIAGESQGAMDVQVNPDGRRWANVNNPYFEDAEGPVYFERPQAGTVSGFPAFGQFEIGRGGWKPVHVFISSNPRPFWLPVSRERVLRYRIAQVRAVPAVRDSPYQAWLRDAPRRARDREAAIAALAGFMRPDSIAAFRAAMERTEREVGDGLRADDARFMAAAAQGQAHMGGHLAELERELATMSPEQRRSQAWIGGTSASMLVPAGTPNTRPLVTPNPDFYDRTRPATDVQALLLEFVTYSQSPYVLALTGAVFRSLDWAALGALTR